MSKYLLASFFGGLIGACCVLVVVCVINNNGVFVKADGEIEEHKNS